MKPAGILFFQPLLLAFTRVICVLAVLAVTPAPAAQLGGQAATRTESAPAESKPGGGVVVERVAPDSAAEKAGLQAGDILLRWSRADSSGTIESPFDPALLEIEQGQRGPVSFEGLRGNQKRIWSIESGIWGIETRPELPPKLLSLYREGQDFAKTGKLPEASERWRQAADQVGTAGPSWLQAWLLFRSAEALAEDQRWEESDAAYELAAQQVAGGEPYIKVQLLRSWTITFERRNDYKNAEKRFYEIAEETKKLAPDSLLFADVLDDLGRSAAMLNDLNKSDDAFSQAMAIQERLAPESLGMAKSLAGRGAVAQLAEDLDQAKKFLQRALVIETKLAPNDPELAVIFNGLGNVAGQRGDLTQSEEYLRRALAISEKVSPETLSGAKILNNLGNVANSRGDFVKAERYYQQSLAIKKKLAPESLSVAMSFNNLGVVAFIRDDMAKAEEYYQQSLALRKKLAPQSVLVAESLNNLAYVAQVEGDPAKVDAYCQTALEIEEKAAPDGLDAADSYQILSAENSDRGDLTKAEEFGRRAVEIEEKLSPESIYLAAALSDLGDVVRKQKDLVRAEKYYRRSMAILQKLAPESKYYAQAVAEVAEIAQSKGDLETAAPLFEQGLNALESQTAHLGGSEEVRSFFRAGFLGYYQQYADLLLQQKQSEQAFHVLERSRAQTLLEMLAKAHIDIHSGVDAALLEREHALAADLSAKNGLRVQLLTGEHTEQELAAITQEIDSLLSEHKDVEEQIRISSPGYAALTQPQALNAKEAQQLLDEDTLLLEYSLGEERSYLFALTPKSLDTFVLPKRAEIEQVARRAYQDELSVNNRASGDHQLNTLSSILLGPVSQQLGKKRLVIVADGALQYVPFAALHTSHGLPLVAEHEVINLPSVSTLAVLRKTEAGRMPAPKLVAVLADPVFDSQDGRVKTTGSAAKNTNRDTTSKEPGDLLDETSANLLTRSAADVGMVNKGAVYLPRLLSTRAEARSILATAPAGTSMLALDFDASRSTATSGSLAQYRIVHFATHGLLDSTRPELSGLVLSLVDKQGMPQNGFLSLQDVYNLNLPADLVVLSACKTGLGEEIRGEGLVGLARAFMYAGSPRVVASLWRVPDLATAELMKRFYDGMLQKGLSPAASLRQAQIALSKDQRWSAPYFWAGFTLQGEWR